MDFKTNIVLTDDIITYRRKIQNQTDERFKKQIREREEIRRRDIILLQNKTSVCPTDAKLTKNKINSLIRKDITHNSKTYFYDADFNQYLTCTLEIIKFYPNDEELKEIKNWFSDIRILGSFPRSQVFLGDFYGIDLLLKISQLREESVHESVVAFYGTNLLRKIIPSFSYIYSAFNGPARKNLKLTTEKDLFQTENYEVDVIYIIQEYVYPNRKITDFLLIANPLQFLNMYIQTILALNVAQKEIGFTHFDLHQDNVLWREPNLGTFQIKFPFRNGFIYVKTSGISTIIDYGFSHIKINNQHTGNGDSRIFSVLPDQDFIIHDVYKFLLNCAEYWFEQRENQEMFEICIFLYKYFSTEQLEDALERQKRFYYAPAVNEKTKNFSLEDFIDYCIDFSIQHGGDEIFSSKPFEEVPFLDCKKMCLHEKEKILNQLNLSHKVQEKKTKSIILSPKEQKKSKKEIDPSLLIKLQKASTGKTASRGGLNVTDINNFLIEFDVIPEKQKGRKNLEKLLKNFLNSL